MRNQAWSPRYLSLIMALLVGLVARVAYIDAPFNSIHGSDGYMSQQYLENAFQFGWSALKFSEARGMGSSPEQLQYHMSEMALAPMLHSGVLRLLGANEAPLPAWSIRIFPILCWSLACVLFFFLCRKWLDGLPLFSALLGFSILPIGTYFTYTNAGAGVFHLATAGGLATLLLYRAWEENQRKLHLLFVALMALITMLSELTLVPVLPVVLLFLYVFRFHRIPWDLTIVLGFTVILCLLVFLGHLYWFYGDTTMEFFQGKFSQRTSGSIVGSYFEIFKSVGYRLIMYLTIPVCLVIITFPWWRRWMGNTGRWWLGLFIFGLGTPLVFRQAAYLHFPLLLYTLPVLALSLGLAVHALTRDEMPLYGRYLAWGMLVLLVTQSALVLDRRINQQQAYPLETALASELKGLSPGTELLSDLKLLDYLFPASARVYMHWEQISSVEALKKVIQDYPQRHFSYLVTTNQNLLVEHVPFFRQLKEDNPDWQRILETNFGVKGRESYFLSSPAAYGAFLLYPLDFFYSESWHANGSMRYPVKVE